MNNKHHTQRGYVLFLAVIVSTIILTLGTLIAGFVRRDLALAGAADQSDVAFYAATSAMSCGRYLDFVAAGAGAFTISGASSRTISCFGISSEFSQRVFSNTVQNYQFSWTTKSGQNLCSILQVVKESLSGGAVATRMIARGYNVSCTSLTVGNVVERVIEFNY